MFFLINKRCGVSTVDSGEETLCEGSVVFHSFTFWAF